MEHSHAHTHSHTHLSLTRSLTHSPSSYISYYLFSSLPTILYSSRDHTLVLLTLFLFLLINFSPDPPLPFPTCTYAAQKTFKSLRKMTKTHTPLQPPRTSKHSLSEQRVPCLMMILFFVFTLSRTAVCPSLFRNPWDLPSFPLILVVDNIKYLLRWKEG